MDIRRRFAGLGIAFDPDRIFGRGHNIIVSLGEKPQDLRWAVTLGLEIDGQHRGIIDADADFLNRGDKEILAILKPQNRRKQFDQRHPANRRAVCLLYTSRCV